jgi:hypothetical protein
MIYSIVFNSSIMIMMQICEVETRPLSIKAGSEILNLDVYKVCNFIHDLLSINNNGLFII